MSQAPQGFTTDYFRRLLPSITATPIKGIFFRLIPAIHADAIEETGPSFALGGRYNRKEEFGALYLSESPETCWAEVMGYYRGRSDLVPDQVLGEFEVSVSKGLDLVDSAVLDRLNVSTPALTDLLDRTIPQAIGSAAWSSGFEGILFPSAARSSHANLAIFKDRLSPASRITRIAVKRFSRP